METVRQASHVSLQPFRISAASSRDSFARLPVQVPPKYFRFHPDAEKSVANFEIVDRGMGVLGFLSSATTAGGPYTLPGSPKDVGNVIRTTFDVPYRSNAFFRISAYNTSNEEGQLSPEVVSYSPVAIRMVRSR